MSDQPYLNGTTIRVIGWLISLVGTLLGTLGILSFVHGGFLILLYAIPFLVAGIVVDKAGRDLKKLETRN